MQIDLHKTENLYKTEFLYKTENLYKTEFLHKTENVYKSDFKEVEYGEFVVESIRRDRDIINKILTVI